MRRVALGKFVQRLVSHPVLSRSRALHAFLNAKNHEFGNKKKDTDKMIPGRKTDSLVAGKALLKKKTEKMSDITAQVSGGCANTHVHAFCSTCAPQKIIVPWHTVR